MTETEIQMMVSVAMEVPAGLPHFFTLTVDQNKVYWEMIDNGNEYKFNTIDKYLASEAYTVAAAIEILHARKVSCLHWQFFYS